MHASEHCQRGLTNPLDEMPEIPEPTITMADGRELTKEAFLTWLSREMKWVSATEEEHDAGMLYIRIPFEQKKEF